MIELPGYQLLRELGRGGMARVYLALHEGLDRHVAIKLMYPKLTAEKAFTDRFLREARIVARLSHTNIITIYDVNVYEGYHYIAMEYLPGETLGDKIKAGIEPGRALSILKQMSMGLKFAHDKGFIHRDIKPENILFREDGSAVITDFGVARAEQSDTRMTEVGTIIGTPHYMSPEQAQGLEIKSNSDIYSLGIVFHEMLTGVVPYHADSLVAIMYKHVHDPIPVLTGQLKIFQPLLDKLLAKKPEDRYQNAGDIIKDIEYVELRLAPDLATRIVPPKEVVKERANERAWITPLKNPALNNLLTQKYVLVFASFIFISVASAILFINLPDDEPQLKDTANIKKDRQLAYQRYVEKERIRQETIAEEVRAEEAIAREAIAREKAERDRMVAQGERLAQQRQERERIAAEKDRLAQKRAERDRRAAEKQRLAQKRKMRDRAIAEKERLALNMRKKVTKEDKTKQKISRFNTRAKSYLQKSRLKDAYNSYQQALAIDANNKTAKKGLNKVAARYLSLALKKAENFDFSKADAYVRSATRISPNHLNLAATQREILQLKNKQMAQNTKKIEVQTAPEKTVSKQRTFGGF